MLFICHLKCSTCKKAEKYLIDNDIAYTKRDIQKDNPTAEEIKAWQEQSGLPLKRFFNTSGMLYRELGLAKKLPELSEAEQLGLLASDGMLVKRPLLIADNGTVFVGFKEAEYAKIL